MEPSLSMALQYHERGWPVTPVVLRKKVPILNDWPNKVLSREEIAHFFQTGEHNVGVVLGSAARGLIDVDLDSPEAIKLAPYFLPQTGCVFGRNSKPRSHWLYQIDEPGRTERLRDPDNGDMI